MIIRPQKVNYLFLVHPSFRINQATRLFTRLFIFNFFSKLSLNVNFTIVYDFYYAYLIALLFVLYIFPVVMSLCDYRSVCVFSLGKKLTKQEDQKLFLTLFGLISIYILVLY